MKQAIALFFLAFLRLIALILSFALSGFSAALFLTFVLFLGSDLHWIKDDPVTAVGAVAFAATVWINITILCLGPALLVLLFAEIARFSSLTLNILAGGLIALVVILLYPERTALPYPQSQVWSAILASGFIAGFIHWCLAGHRAGRWLGTRASVDQE